MSIEDDRFKKYEQDLTKNLSVEQPSGSDLKYVNETDIRRWGITKFSDIKILCYNIRQIVNKNQNDMNDNNVTAVANEEGAIAISGGYYK